MIQHIHTKLSTHHKHLSLSEVLDNFVADHFSDFQTKSSTKTDQMTQIYGARMKDDI